jgi:hypothetical protein
MWKTGYGTVSFGCAALGSRDANLSGVASSQGGMGADIRLPDLNVNTLRLSGGRVVSLPAVMGVLNVTPDSFSDGGRYLDPDRAAEHAFEMAEAGA